MTIRTLAFAATLTLAGTGFAFAQQAATLDDLDADRINDNQITIDFEYDGSACENVDPATVGEVNNNVLSVTFTTTATAEVCTQQIVEKDVEQTIEADAAVTAVEVTLLRPDSTVWATGTVNVEND